jgi:phosphatidylinositol alpha-1,6-mannosyltransferase
VAYHAIAAEVCSVSIDRGLDVLLCLPPAKVSNEIDTLHDVPGARVRVLSSDDGLHERVDFPLPARRLPYVGHPDRWTAALAWLRGMDTIDPGPTDIVVSQELYNPGSLQANRLARRRGLAHAVLIAEILPRSPLYRLPPWCQISRRVAAGADGFVCISETARRHAVERGCPADRTSVVHLGVDTKVFRPAAAGRAPEPVVVFVGELRPDKGIRELVAACQEIARLDRDLRLVVVGDGPLWHELHDAASRLPFLQAMGRRPRAEVADLLRSARVASVPSVARPFWAEQFGFALVEAMACGLPVVTTDCGAIPEVVPSWNPIVPQGDAGALRDALLEALGPDGDDWGRRNREVVVERYDVRRQGVALGAALRHIAAQVPTTARG